MNHIYRLCWSRTRAQWIPAPELADAGAPAAVRAPCRPVTGRRTLALSALALALCAAGMAHAGTGLVGGQITGGTGQIQQVGAVTTIRQGSPTLTLDWQDFDIAPNQTVNFVQPGSSAIAVNRIFSSTPSAIYGQLNANGQVWLINPNGILFGQGAQVNVGGLVASTLDLDDSTLASNTRSFGGTGKGSVINEGAITIANGGYAALIGNQVSNRGVISAQLGTVALGGGSAVTLTFNNDQLLHVQVDRSTLDNLAENRQLIVANGGQVIMTAGAKDALLASVVNNTGIVRAQTVQNHDGTITLLGGMQAGTVNVGGTLDASAPNGGSGGSIETSAANFNLASGTRITASAPQGRAGTWLVDPTDLTIDAASAATISSTLNGGTNVTEQTTATGASGVGVQSAGAGDINVDAPISWSSAAASLSLQAYHAINVNAPVTGAGGVSMNAGGANLTIAAGASIMGGAGVTLATAANFVNQAGANAVATGTSAPWLIYSSNPTLDTAGGLAPDFIQYNAAYPTTPVGSGNGFLYRLAPTLTITGFSGMVSKVYDGTTAATIAGSNLTATGLVNGNVIATASGSYGSPNAGSGIAVTGPGAISAITLTDASGTIPVYGYTLSGAAVSANVGTITPAPLTATIINNPTKVYNGTTSAAVTSNDYSLSGFVAGQGAAVSQHSPTAYASATAGTETITATFSSTDFTANAGTNLNNYILPATASGLGTITPAPLLISGVLATSKVYDGTASDTLNTGAASLYGVISGDAGAVALDSSAALGTFSQSNVGNGLAVAASGFVLTGSKALDYVLTQPQGLSANITPLALSIAGVTANSKVYDATNAATLNLGGATLSGVIAGDNVTLSDSGASATFGQSNVGNNLAVTATGFTLGGTAAGNYTISQPSGLTADITPAPLTITFSGNPTKTYDGTTAATLDNAGFTVSGFVAGQSAVISQTSSSTYASPNAGNGIAVTATLEASDFTPASGTSLSNYSFPASISGTGTINPIVLSGGIVNNPTKVYDGNANALLGSANYSLNGVLSGQSITVTQTSGTYASPNAGVEQVSAVLDASDYAAGSGTLLSNYVLPAVLTGYGTITPAPVSISFNAAITGNPTKVYDGNNIATLAAGDFTLSGFQGSDSATVNQTIDGQYASKNVGTQPVTASMIESDFTPGPGTDLSNYSFPITAYGTGTITPAPLTATIIGNPAKVYNGTTSASITSADIQFSGFVSGEGATVTPSSPVNYDSPNAGSEGVTAQLASSDFTANAGTLLTNYILPVSATGTGTITPAPLYITGVYANSKVYDATTAATLNVSQAALSGLVVADNGKVDLTSATTGTFAQANVGTDLAVAPGAFSISGPQAGNYTLVQPGGLVANITPATLTISGILANSKIYDGTTTDSLDTTAGVLNGVYGGDTVTFSSSGASGTFSTANAGNNLAVSASGFSIGGASAANYVLAQPTGLTANITPAPLTATITGAPTKVYDGSTSALLTASDYTLTGFVAGQGATIPQSASSSYGQANAGTGLSVSAELVSSDFLANAGTNLSNYLLPSSAFGNNGVITPVVLNLTGTRVYDATTNAAASLFGNNGVLAGINGDTLTLSGTGTLSTKNVGVQQPFAGDGLAGFTLAGNGSALASNYTLIGGTDWVTITPAMLTVSGTVAATKIYDGTVTASLSGSTLNGVFAGDTVDLGNDTSGSFNNKNVGNNKPVSTDMTISGTDASNYVIVQPAAITGSITPLTISVTAAGQNKAYDGTTTANVSLSSTGVLAGDSVSFADTSANFIQSDVGNGLQINVAGISAGGTDGGNYLLANTTATTSADITPRILNLTATRVYDTTTNAAASLFGSNGVLTGVAGQTLQLGGTGTLSTKNVGNQQPFASGGLDGFTLTGIGAANPNNYTLVGGTDWVTITPYQLSVTSAQAQSKTYDGTTLATITGATLSSPLSGDTVTLSNDTTGTFATRNVGNDIAVSTAMTLTGADAGNYQITQPAGLVANITPLAITVSATGNNKVYDTTTTASVNLSSNGILAGDNVSFTDSAANFVSPNVANGIQIDVSGISATGGDAANYSFNTTAATSANITPVILNLTGTRVYDATTNADLNLFGNNGVLAGIAGQTLTLGGSGVAALSTKNVGAQQPFAAGAIDNFSLSGNNGALASNYTLIGGTDWVTITPYTLTVDGTVAASKIYNGNTTAALSGSTLVGVFAGDNVALGNDSVGGFASKNVGDNITVSTAMTIGGTDAGNYILQQPTNVAANITPLAITVAATGNDKSYDGTTTAMVGLSSSGVLPGDSVNFSDGSANFSTANAGSGIGIAVDGITASGADAGNYTFNNTAATSANITPAIINLAGTQVYNGSTAVNASAFGTDGVIAGVDGQTLVLSGAGSAPSKNVGNDQPLTLGSLALNGNDGSLASNYTLVGGTESITITPLAVTVSAVGQNKVYDGNTGATVALSATGTVPSDDIQFSYGNASFDSPNAGNQVPILVSGISATGQDLSNYTFNTTAATSADITPYVLNLSGTRVYDGSTSAQASLFGSNGVISGINGDTLSLSGTGVVSSKNVDTYTGTAQFDQNDLALTGNGAALASNYTLVGGTDTLTITPLAITVGAIGQDKTYDGTTTASVSLVGAGLVGGDIVSFTDTSATFNSPNAGSNVPITVAGISAAGADAGNYTFNTSASTVATIDPAVLNLTSTRVYDATTAADASLFGNNGVLTGVAGQTLTLTGNGTLSTKNVGVQQSFAAGGLDGFTLTGDNGALASNYTFVGGNDWVTITPAILNVTGTTASNRVYDGSTADTLSGSQLAGVFAGDDVTLDNDTVGTFNNKNVGNNKAVTTDMTIAGADAGNYILLQPTGLTANVTPLAITVDATGTNKVYDGNTLDTVGLGSAGVVAGDQVAFADTSANFSDKNVGYGKSVTADGITASGADAGNYILLNTTATTTADITPLAITIGAIGTNKVFDGNALDMVSLYASGVLPGDQLSFADASALFSDPHAGNGKTVTVSGITGSGVDIGNYIFNTTTTTTANITPLPITVLARGTNRPFNGGKADAVALSSMGLLPGYPVSFIDSSASFGSPAVGNNKPVTVYGIGIAGPNAGDYLVTDPTATTEADITDLGDIGTGVQGSWLAQIDSTIEPESIATPYGTADMSAVGVFNGNQKKRHRPIERNVIRSDFHSGLPINVIHGGVRLPTDASP
ncbi:filamentous hemagglutinin N-terminal domain-containing protein [Dyella jejuensis]|uniref:Filamentous hemagglutinin N-terminal domain-containing protein n=1 Tax=Dyella jejuensis TaxID=1432009 RepID=A0ABW8JHY9_9GAMM